MFPYKSGNFYGRKLIIEIPIEQEPDFLGGQGVPTNASGSGIYKGDNTLMEIFKSPTVNVVIPKIDVTAEDKNVYLSDELETEDMLRDAAVSIGSQQLKLGEKNFGLKPWQYAFLQEIELTTDPATWNGTEDGTFTVTCTVTPNHGDAKEGTSAAANIYVFKPEITFNDTTMHLGTAADYKNNGGSVDWIHDTATGTILGEEPAVKVTYNTAPAVFEDCTDVSVKEVFLGKKDADTDEIVYSATNYFDDTTFVNVDDDDDANHQFTVHVLTPTVSIDEQVIYLSQSFENTDSAVSITWEKACGDGNKLSGPPTASVVFDAGSAKLTPLVCGEHTAYLQIGTSLYTNFKATFKLHVLVPIVSVKDFSMYLGTSVTLDNAERISETWTCSENGEDNRTTATGGRSIPTSYGYNFYADNVKVDSVYAPDSDKTIIAVPKIDTTEYPAYQKGFEIDVMMPIIAVPQKQVWADYQKPVDMVKWYGTADSENTTWNAPKYGIANESKAPDITCEYEFSVTAGNGSWSTGKEHEEYKQGSVETLMTVTKATWNYVDDKPYVATVSDDNLVVNAEYDFKINTNKFDLTISKTWDGADVYKQDAIFTVSGGLGEFQVVLPAGQESIVIKGLLCGQDYTVTEDSNWTWRWKATAEQSVNCKSCENDGHHDVNPANPHDPNTPDKHGSNAITFENILNRLKTKWFDFCKLVMENIFGVGSFERRGN